MALTLRLDAQAARDLADIRSYLIENAGSPAADRVRIHIRLRLERLRRQPLLGAATSEPRIRILPPTRYRYRIYYTVKGDTIVVLHIRHASRRDPNPDELGK